MKIRVTNLRRKYRSDFELFIPELTIDQGVTAVVGPNGAGKSTFFRILSGFESPTSGSVTVDDRAFSRADQKMIGYLPQRFSYPSRATGEQFLHYAAWLQRVPAGRRRAAVSDAMQAVDLLSHGTRKIGQLSGGMRHRLAIAHALVHKPQVLILDEPSAGLDPAQRVGLRKCIRSLSEERTVVMSTHLVEEIRHLADRVIVLAGGRIAFDGSLEELSARARSDADGDTDLERGLVSVIDGDQA
jgi:ABC-2 type transport system ATP-binding protein